MAIKSFPYVSIEGDRKITAAQEAQSFDMFIKSGIVPGENGFEVSKIEDTLNVSVSPGRAVVTGHRIISDADETLSLSAGGVNPRIDIIALESNSNTPVRAGRLVVVEGVPAATPEEPELTQTDAVYQIPLAKILVPAGVQNLNSTTLTDARVMAKGHHGHDLSEMSGQVNTPQIAMEAITTGRLANYSITPSKVAPGHVVGARFKTTVNQSVPANTDFFIQWPIGGRVYNPDNSHEDQNLRVMVARYDGVYTIIAHAEIVGTFAARLRVRKNGIVIGEDGFTLSDNGNTGLTIIVDNVPMVAGDFLEVYIRHGVSGGDSADLIEGASLSMRRNPF